MKVCKLDGCENPARRKFCCREHQLKARATADTQRRDELTVPPVHVVIPDVQSKPGVPNEHLSWIGRYIVDQFGGHPDLTIVQIGDFWDMPSLSSYDRGKKSMEGRRYMADIAAGNKAFALLDDPIRAETARTGWKPRKVFLFGNHEERIVRAIESDAQLDGILSLDDCNTRDWERIPFLKPIEIHGVWYCHYWQNKLSGKPMGGENLTLRLKNIGHTFTMGHQQQLLYCVRYVANRSQHGLVAGSAYVHDESYLGPQGNSHWRGIIVCHQVEGGSYDPMFVSLDFLSRKFTGHRLSDYEAREL